MPATLLIAAAGLAIPFGSPPASAPADTSLVEMSASFEFAETDQGFDLNAVVERHDSGLIDRVRIDHCRTIDIDSFNEDLFGTPALCDGRRYVFDVVGRRLVAVAGAREQDVLEIAATHLVLNGVPLMVEDEPALEESSVTGDEAPR